MQTTDDSSGIDAPKVTSTGRPPLSAAQLAANQANAQHSTGPRTDAGKARAASNALKHGLRSALQAQNLYLLRNESPDELHQLRAALTDEFRPHTATQHLLFQQLIALQIRYLRAQRYYHHLLYDKVDAMRPQVEATYLPPYNQGVANALAFEALADNGKALLLLTRDLDRLPTKIQRLIKELKAIPPSEIEANIPDEPQNDTNEPISSPDLLPEADLTLELTPELTPESEPVLACSVVNCIQADFPCPNCRPIGEVPRVNDQPDWPPDCIPTHPEPIISLLHYHIDNPEVDNFVNPNATRSNEEIWALVDEEMKTHPFNDDNIQPGEEVNPANWPPKRWPPI